MPEIRITGEKPKKINLVGVPNFAGKERRIEPDERQMSTNLPRGGGNQEANRDLRFSPGPHSEMIEIVLKLSKGKRPDAVSNTLYSE